MEQKFLKELPNPSPELESLDVDVEESLPPLFCPQQDINYRTLYRINPTIAMIIKTPKLPMELLFRGINGGPEYTG